MATAAANTGIFGEYAATAKTILYVIATIVGLVALYFIIKWIRDTVRTGAQVANIGSIAATVSAAALTYPKNQYILFADNLFTAMDSPGTNEDTIFEIFGKLKNDDDVAQLITAFGIRTIDGYFTENDFSLPQAIRDELDASELAKLNSILTSKGITYIF